MSACYATGKRAISFLLPHLDLDDVEVPLEVTLNGLVEFFKFRRCIAYFTGVAFPQS